MLTNTKKGIEINFEFNKSTDCDSALKIGDKLLTLSSEVHRLVGVISDNLKWFGNTKQVISKGGRGFSSFQIKILPASQDDLLRTVIRPIFEYVAPLWHSSITKV